MAKIYEFGGVTPVIDPKSFVHPEAAVIGDVVVGPRCYIGPFASLRGDFGNIVIGEGVNFQDSCVMHSFPGKTALIENNGHIGHGAFIHGCVVGQGALVGMNSVVMDGAVIGERAFVGACSFVKAGFKVPPRHLVAGNPAKIVRELSDKEILWKHKGTEFYQKLAERSLMCLRPARELFQIEKNRKSVSWEDIAAPLYELKE